MKLITYNIMALAFLGSAMYLHHSGSHQWGWLVFLSLISAVSPTTQKSDKVVTKEEDPKKDLHQELQERANENNN